MSCASELLQQFTRILLRHVGAGDKPHFERLLVAYSGGLDSSVLLSLTVEFARLYQVPVRALHVNHQLSVNASDWQQHCQAICKQLNVELQVKKVEITAQGAGIESAAREARYQAIAEETDEKCLVLLGQHKQDQTETFLLQLLRGAGPGGLSAMAEYSRNQFGSHLLRPLLSIDKNALQNWALNHDIKWIEDESNDCDDFDRNFLRNQVVPLIAQRWPQMHNTINRSIAHIAEQNRLFQAQVAEQYASLLNEERALNIVGLSNYSKPWQKQILKHWIQCQGALQPSAKVLMQVLNDCLVAREDAQPQVKWGVWQCCRFDGHLYLLQQSPPMPDVVLEIKPLQPLLLPADSGQLLISHKPSSNDNSASLSLPEDALLSVTFGGFSRRFRPHNSQHSKPLTQWFKEWKIPPWQRQKTPILVFQNEIVAVGDTVAAPNSAINQQQYLIQWLR